MCLQHTHLASTTGNSLPPAPSEISELPTAQRRVKGLIDTIVGQARKRGIGSTVAGWLEQAAQSLRK